MQALFYKVTCLDCSKVFEMITAFADFKHINCPSCDGKNLQIEQMRLEEKDR